MQSPLGKTGLDLVIVGLAVVIVGLAVVIVGLDLTSP
jgi:hypothetical protein